MTYRLDIRSLGRLRFCRISLCAYVPCVDRCAFSVWPCIHRMDIEIADPCRTPTFDDCAMTILAYTCVRSLGKDTPDDYPVANVFLVMFRQPQTLLHYLTLDWRLTLRYRPTWVLFPLEIIADVRLRAAELSMAWPIERSIGPRLGQLCALY